MADTSAWRVVEAAEGPTRRGRAQSQGQSAPGIVAPAYGPDVT